MYLTFDEYQQYGGTLEEATFQDLAFEAESVINWWTFNRLQNEETYPEAVKRCVYKLISLISDRQKAMIVDASGTNGVATAGITGESNDGVSTTYNTLSASEAANTLKDEMHLAIRMYLQGIKNSLGHNLLYRGVYPGE